METKFTSGNWIAKKYSTDWGVYSDQGNGNDIALVRDKGGNEGEANAALIASAPLLYEALQRLYDFTVGDKDAKYLDQILNECQSALSSATGEGE